MAVLVKRFKVRYNGVVYGPGQPGGQIIKGLSKEEEARLIAGSNGAIVKYVPVEVVEEEEAGDIDEMAAPGAEQNTPLEDVEDAKIPEIKPEELIKPKKKGRK